MRVRFIAVLAVVPFFLVLTADVADAQLTRVSVASDGTQGNGHSYAPAMSTDGRFVAFCSDASNLVADDTNQATDVFVHNRLLATTERVSVASDGSEADGHSCRLLLGNVLTRPVLSGDGRYVAFLSEATNLIGAAADTNGWADVFVRDRQRRTTIRVSVGTGGVENPHGLTGTAPLLGGMSDDGTQTLMTMLFAPPGFDPLARGHTFIHDSSTNTTSRPLDPDDNSCAETVLSFDKRWLITCQGTAELVPADRSFRYLDWSVVVTNRITGERSRLARIARPLGLSDDAAIALLAGMTGLGELSVWNRTTGHVVPLPHAISGLISALLSRDGEYVLLSGETQDAGTGVRRPFVLWRNIASGLTRRIDVTTSGGDPEPITGQVVTVSPHNKSVPSNSRIIAFESFAANLLDAGTDTNGAYDVFVREIFDEDRDGLPDEWEAGFGLSPYSGDGSDGPMGDPDGDGHTNADEFAAGSHPTGTVARYFAEGARSTFFSTQFAVFNPDATTTASVLFRFQRADASSATRVVSVPPLSRRTIVNEDLAALGTADFSTVVESNVPVVVDRTMAWDARGYGSHTETSIAAPATTWYLAEGATHSGFNLFYLVQNPNDQPASVQITYLLPAPRAPVVRGYTFAANSRGNVWVDAEGAQLDNTDVSAVIVASLPIVVERAMYLDRPGQVFSAGHVSAGVTQPSTEWILTEGATGAFFDTFLLLANPSATDEAQVSAAFLLPGGFTWTKVYRVPAQSRLNVWLDAEVFPDGHHGQRLALADTAVSIVLTAVNSVPIVAERSMWWPGPTATTWAEAHNSAGLTSTGRTWALAEGEVGGTRGTETYVLIANRGSADTASVTVYYEDGTNESRMFPLAAGSRTTSPWVSSSRTRLVAGSQRWSRPWAWIHESRWSGPCTRMPAASSGRPGRAPSPPDSRRCGTRPFGLSVDPRWGQC